MLLKNKFSLFTFLDSRKILKNVTSIKNIKKIIHLAAFIDAEESVKNPLLYWDNNLCGSIALLKVMQKYECQNIVFSSSATLYGNSSKKLITESRRIL